MSDAQRKLRERWSRSLHRRVVRELWQTDRTATVVVGGGVTASAALTVATLVVSGSIVGRIPDAVRDGASSAAADRIWLLLIALGTLQIAQQVLLAIQEWTVPPLSRRFDTALRERVMTATMAPARVEHLSDPAVVDDIAAATTLGTARFGPMTAAESFAPLMLSLFQGLALAAVVCWYYWWIGLLLAGAWLLARAARRRDITTQYRQMATPSVGTRRQSYFRQLSLASGAAKEIRVFGLSGWVVDSFREQWLATMTPAWRARRRYPWQLVASLIAVPLVHLLALIVVVDDARGGRLGLRSLSIVLPAILGTAVLADPGGITIYDMMYAAGASTVEAAERVERRFGTDIAQQTEPDRGPLGTVRFDGVSYRYPNQDRDVLHALDVELVAGRSLAIVGANGAGKTTLVRLLCGLLTPSAGQITLDRASIDSINPDRWRAQIAVVWQDFARLPFSARENVTIGSPNELNDTEVAEIAARAGLDDVIAALPERWNTPLARNHEGGVDLSGGQWQRVALARALAATQRGATLLILDEPTANLDVRAEAAFYDQFLENTRGLTTIVISHRFATVRRADRIAVLDGGRITELGTHEQLLRANGAYAGLFRLQSAAFDEPEASDA